MTALVLMTGVAAGVVMTAAAGARRTESAYPRFLQWANPPDAGFNIAGGFGLAAIDPRDVTRLPEVRSSVLTDSFLFTTTTADGDYLFIGQGAGGAVPSSRSLREEGRVKILHGRMFDPGDPHEVIVGIGTAAPQHLQVGTSVLFRFLRRGKSPDIINESRDPSFVPRNALTSPFRATVVGISFAVGDFGDNSYGDVEFTPAFDRQFRDRIAPFPGMSVRLQHGEADLPRLNRDLQRLGLGGNVGTVSGPSAFTSAFERLVHPRAAALWIFAVLAALAALLIIGQSVSRQAFLDADDDPTLRALGMSNDQLFLAAMLRYGAVALAAAVLGVVIATLASPLMPIGPARIAEPNPGISIDLLVFAAGAALTVLSIVGIAAIAAWRTTSARYADPGVVETRARPSIVAESLARSGLPPTVPTGARMALERGRGRTAVPARSAIVGAALAVAAVTASLVVAASFQHLFETPRLYGWSWDAALGNPYVADLSKRVLPKLEGNPYLTGYSGGNLITGLELSHANETLSVSSFGIDQIEGHVHPPVLEGKWPTSTNEIVLGTKTLRELHAHLGDTIRVAVGEKTEDVHVVGRAVFIDVGGTGGLGQGAGMSLQGLRVLIPKVPENIFMLDLALGATIGQLSDSLGDLSDGLLVLGRNVSGDEVSSFLRDLRPVKRFPLGLAALLALAAVATIAHTLVSSIRRRRRDLAILKTLGFVRRQVSAAVSWQATTLVVVSLVTGVPLGLVAGRWAWTAFSDQLGVVPEPTIPVVAVLLAVPATLLLANLIAYLPGRAAARVRAAAVLRTE